MITASTAKFREDADGRRSEVVFEGEGGLWGTPFRLTVVHDPDEAKLSFGCEANIGYAALGEPTWIPWAHADEISGREVRGDIFFAVVAALLHAQQRIPKWAQAVGPKGPHWVAEIVDE